MRLPGAFRCLPRPSSALKPSHSPDGVACRAVGNVCLAFGETFFVGLCFCLCVVSCERCAQFTLHSASAWALMGVACCLWLVVCCQIGLEAGFADIRVVSCVIRVLCGGCCENKLVIFGYCVCFSVMVVWFFSVASFYVVKVFICGFGRWVYASVCVPR